MRIQHNIPAMSSYRNYSNNVSALSKNLEKLSSGYKINRAGDDAAGLAISEKMRAQITGLEVAQKNAKDGISLVQTAEGALTEVHDMLNRMFELAEQSANGTYDDEVDRNQLNKELNQLRTEINRVADSSNFNGIKLLDGSLSGESQAQNVTVTESTAVKGKYTTQAIATSAALITTGADGLTVDDIGKTIDYTVTWQDSKGNEKNLTVSLVFQGDGKGGVSGSAAKNYFVGPSGNNIFLQNDGTIKKDDLKAAIKAGLTQDKEFSSAFTITENGDAFEFEAKENGSAGAKVLSIGIDHTTSLASKAKVWAGTSDGVVSETTAPLDALHKFDATSIAAAEKTMEQDEIEQKIFKIDGHKFLLNKDLTEEQIKALGEDVTVIKVAGSNATADTEVRDIAANISRVTGLQTKVYKTSPGGGITADKDIVFKDRLKLGGTDLRLQIGDTSDSFNQMRVKISDCHAAAMGIGEIDISSQDGASEAMDKIKDAINYVSDVRGTLGATQNRLDHTINNLSVMQQNIQDAESTIRDVDVAAEMMNYTKNNILVQSAQAMLAQANQLPQGVLQLLQ